jgi:hypothetical protein
MNPARMFLESLDRRSGIREQPGSISTELGSQRYVRFTPGSDRIADIPERQLRAMKRHMFPTGIYLANSVAKKSCTSKTERCAASALYLTQWPKDRMPSRKADTLKACYQLDGRPRARAPFHPAFAVSGGRPIVKFPDQDNGWNGQLIGGNAA